MTPKDIVQHLQTLFEPTVSPGQAFDALFKMRQERVTWDDAYNAVVTNGKAQRIVRRVQRLDERDESEEQEFQCPGCGVARTNRDTCVVPGCSENKVPPLDEEEHVKAKAATVGGKFKDPVISFGQYKGKKLTEVGVINPGYLKWMAQSHSADFWREQAKMAMFVLESQSPLARDTSDTGFFGQ